MRTHGINPEDFPVGFKRWHKFIHALLEEQFISDDFRYNRLVVISCDSQSINLTFYPNRAASPLIVNHQGRRIVQPRDTGVEVVLFFDHDSPDCWKDSEEFWESLDEGCGAVPLPYAWQPYYNGDRAGVWSKIQRNVILSNCSPMAIECKACNGKEAPAESWNIHAPV